MLHFAYFLKILKNLTYFTMIADSFFISSDALRRTLVPPGGEAVMGPIVFRPPAGAVEEFLANTSQGDDSVHADGPTFNTTVYLRNNFTIVERLVFFFFVRFAYSYFIFTIQNYTFSIPVWGKGGSGRLVFNALDSGDSSLAFHLNASHLQPCLRHLSPDEEVVVRYQYSRLCHQFNELTFLAAGTSWNQSHSLLCRGECW